MRYHVYDLEGKKWDFKVKRYIRKKKTNRSSYHQGVYDLLKQIYPHETIIEELYLPGINLYADFYLLMKDVIIEVHGEQHYTPNTLFHSNNLSFRKQQLRDKQKKRFCEINDIKYLELKYNEQKYWEQQIRNL